MTSAIVCVDNNWGIGYDGKLLTYIPEDMRFFKEMTSNSVVIMGRKTYNSLPSKPLPNRVNVVVTSKIDRDWEIDENGTVFASMDVVKMYLSFIHPLMPIDYMIIGGGHLYRNNQLL